MEFRNESSHLEAAWTSFNASIPLSLCGAYSFVDGSGATCLGVGIPVAAFLRTQSYPLSIPFEAAFELDYLFPWMPITADGMRRNITQTFENIPKYRQPVEWRRTQGQYFGSLAFKT